MGKRSIRLTDDEEQGIQARRRVGETFGGAMHRVLALGLRRRPPAEPVEVREARLAVKPTPELLARLDVAAQRLEALEGQVRRLGNNVNQFVAKLHAGKQPSATSSGTLSAALDRLTAEVAGLRRDLGGA